MTLADESRATTSGPGEFDRTPPQAIEAEQSVLGAMMMSKDAIADVVEILRPGDFYRPAHQLIYDAILDLYARGEPADPITTAEELTRAGQLTRVGGALVLHTLVNAVPTAANAGYYAQIVAERATLRRLVTVELPLAVPVITAGVRVGVVSNISLASVGKLIGVSSLGYLFIDGLQRSFPTEIYLGLVLVIALAVACDLILVAARRALTPWAERPRGRRQPGGEGQPQDEDRPQDRGLEGAMS